MSRLTLKELELLNTASAYNGAQHNAICGKAVLELIEYKKIEEELGIDLIILFKALQDGIWVKKAKNYDKEKYPYNAGREDLLFFDKEFIYLNCIDELAYEKDYYKGFVLLKDYGKTWALTMEELL